MNSSLNNCLVQQIFSSPIGFFNCYVILASLNWPLYIFQIVLVLLTIVSNSTLIILLARKSTKKSIFDQVLIAHCIVNLFTGLIIAPFYHFFYLFTYWPFGNLSSMFWTSLNDSRNSITNCIMLYMTWIRYRSVKAPSSFEKELMSRWPATFCACIWIIVLSVYIPTTFAYGVRDYSIEIRLNSPYEEFFLLFFTWFIPMAGIKFYHIYIQVILQNRSRIRNSIIMIGTETNHSFETFKRGSILLTLTTKQRIKRMLHIGPMVRFQIIIMFFWFQWISPCVIGLINPFCKCVTRKDASSVNWLTYIVCLTDPIVILILNPSVTFNSIYKSRRSIK